MENQRLLDKSVDFYYHPFTMSMYKACQLKAEMLPITTLRLLSSDVAHVQQQLADAVQQAPGYFRHAPMILDVSGLNNSDKMALDIAALCQLLKAHCIIPVGLRGLHAKKQQQLAISNGLALLKSSHHANTNATAQSARKSMTKIIHKPIRAGERVYVQGGDLIVLASVNPGAECLADGNIHVYGKLRGRALAGVSGDTTRCVFCQQLDAELVAIAGHYQTHDGLMDLLQQQTIQGTVQVYWQDEQLLLNRL